MATKSVCPFVVNELEWNSFLKTYDDRLGKIINFYRSKSSTQFIVHTSEENTYTFRCIATKNDVHVTLPTNVPNKPNVFLMRNISIVESTRFH